MARRKRILAALASTLAHLVFLALLAMPLPAHKAPPPPVIEVEVALAPATPLVAATKPLQQKTGGSSVLPWAALSPSRTILPSRPGEKVGNQTPDFFSPFAPSEEWQGKSLPPEENGALQWVYRKTHLSLGYPSELVRHGIAGQVQARLFFDQEGRFLLPQLSVRSDSRYLKVYVYRLLERTFRDDPVPASLRKWKERLRVDCYVRFSFRESEASVTLDLPETIVGRSLYFARTQLKSRVLEKLEWELGPLHGMLPLPAVSLDVLWFARKIEELKKPRLPVDDLAPYRSDPLFGKDGS